MSVKTPSVEEFKELERILLEGLRSGKLQVIQFATKEEIRRREEGSEKVLRYLNEIIDQIHEQLPEVSERKLPEAALIIIAESLFQEREKNEALQGEIEESRKLAINLLQRLSVVLELCEPAIMSESSLIKDWNRPEEDMAWQNL